MVLDPLSLSGLNFNVAKVNYFKPNNRKKKMIYGALNVYGVREFKINHFFVICYNETVVDGDAVCKRGRKQ